MPTPTPLFTVTFWQVTFAQVVAGAASGVLTALGLGSIGSAEPGTHVSVPWWGLLVGAGIGALTALCHALVGQGMPGTQVASFIPTPSDSGGEASPH